MFRIAVIRFAQESNSFNPIPTGRAAFADNGWLKGDAVRETFRDTASELGGAIAFIEARADWDGVYLRAAQAGPGGPVEDSLINAVIDEVVSDLRAQGPFNGAYVSLHGAMVGKSRLRPDYDLLVAVRQAVGPDCPIAASFDFHANMTPDIAAVADMVVGYKTYPHIDTAETAAKALSLLARAIEGRVRPKVLIRPVGLLLPSHNMRTAEPPMAAIEARAAEMETANGFWDITPFGGFAYGDVPQAGACVSVTFAHDRESTAETVANDIAQAFVIDKEKFRPLMPGPAEGIARALQRVGQGRPVAVVEPADNPMSGGIGDTPELFRALVQVVQARPDVPALFAFFADPEAASRAHAAGLGAALDLALGGRLTPEFGAPVPVRATVEALNDGHFVNRGPMWTGEAVALGPSALLKLDGAGEIRVIVTSHAVSPNDPAYFALFGVDLGTLGLLCVKAKNHFRAAFAGTFGAIIDVDTLGPASADLSRLPFRHAVAERL